MLIAQPLTDGVTDGVTVSHLIGIGGRSRSVVIAAAVLRFTALRLFPAAYGIYLLTLTRVAGGPILGMSPTMSSTLVAAACCSAFVFAFTPYVPVVQVSALILMNTAILGRSLTLVFLTPEVAWPAAAGSGALWVGAVVMVCLGVVLRPES